ncbi:MAG TPA: DEAD/DEAH box helicase family protein, partial [Bacilli bacterium]|nr:DEAD/DEAH box helicase family protein [Bacilli bacterium]
IKPILDSMPKDKLKFVVWLVPSNSILEQTIKNLTNKNHPYRQKIDLDFNNKVEVYTKEELINAQNFNPTVVSEQLSICVLSYDSLRSNKKEGRKVYQENSNLTPFKELYNTPETLIENIDETALMQVINQLSPVVIVDESHNATSELSIEMLNNLNPSFILELTATPKENSNIITYVEAIKLKKANMVKLPVIVYNRHGKEDVLVDAIDLRNNLEKEAKNNKKYIRPIILFQAQTQGNENHETFEKIKKSLIEIGIPEKEIAIKTADINELKNLDLLSPDCPIKYIITVNALKEGWDCPFAYILATLANRNSPVDVEQILGRILRQPYAEKAESIFLNMSYVLTSSKDFLNTLENIIKGLNRAGFTDKDYYAESSDDSDEVEATDNQVKIEKTINNKQLNIENLEDLKDIEETEINNADDITFDIESIVNRLDSILLDDSLEGSSINNTIKNNDMNNTLNKMLEIANQRNNEYAEKFSENNDQLDVPSQVGEKMKTYKMVDAFKEDALHTVMPQFFIKTPPSIFFEESKVLLSKENLSEGFILSDKDIMIDFDNIDDNIYKVDVVEGSETTPKYTRMSINESEYFRKYISKASDSDKITTCTEIIYKNLDKIDYVSDKELRPYIKRIISNMTKDQILGMEASLTSYTKKIKTKIIELRDTYLETRFEQLIESNQIVCNPSYTFQEYIAPANVVSGIVKSLYTSEEKLSPYEHNAILAIASLDNVSWWHKIIEKKDFWLNGFINHYPDFVIKTKKGNVVLVEIKGDYLDGTDSKRKVKLGRMWENKLGNNFHYFMVYDRKELNIEGVKPFDKFMEIIKAL